MFYNGFKEKGTCPAGGPHVADATSFNYRVDCR
jgi:hypothetical protein